nr:hypothetical protein [Tanacetum cinerariifolium]
MWNNTSRVNHKNFANKMTHPHLKIRFLPQAILIKLGKLNTAGTPVNIVRPVNTADSKPIVNCSRPISNAFKREHSQVIRPFNKYSAYKKTIFNKMVNTIRAKDTTARESAVGNPQQKEYKEKGVIDSGCSGYMTKKNSISLIMKIMIVDLFPLEMAKAEFIAKPLRMKLVEILKTFITGIENQLDCKVKVTRTPHQNSVVEKKNTTLIEAARTIRPPLIDFMKPFGCPVTILNTRDHLGKFDGKADEGFFIGYSVVRNGPDWIFDIDSLTISMNYEPVVAGKQTNGIAGPKDNIVADQAEKKKEPKQEYILIPICTTDPLISQGPKDSVADAGKKATKVDESGVSNNGGQDDQVTRRTRRMKEAYWGQIDKTLFIKRHKDDILLVQVYVDDIIFGSTKKELSTEFEKLMHDKFQMSSMGELSFVLRLQVQQKSDGIFISQDKYMVDILKKFDFSTVKITSTIMEPNKALVMDVEAEDVDVYLYRLMIGSLMYLTASRPDITFVVCACVRFQVTPKTSHLLVVKRIFKYLKGQPKLGLWYPRDSPFDLKAYSNSDYAGAILDKKYTIREYVATANCYGQVLWIQNQMLDYGFNFLNTKIYIDNENTICIVKNPVFHSKTKHTEIRHHFIRDSYEKKLIQVIKIHTDQNVIDLLTKAFDGKGSTVSVESHHTPSGNPTISQPWHSSLSKVESLEIELKLTKQIYGATFTKLIKKDSSKQGRMIEDIDQDERVILVTPTKVSSQEDQPEDQLGVLSAAMILTDATTVHTYSRRRRAVSTGSGELQEEIDAAERQRMAQVYQAAQTFIEDEWENFRARVKTDGELTQRLQAEEREKYSEYDRIKMLFDLINQRKKFFAKQRVEAKRNKPMTQAQQRTYMSNYIKHMGSYTLKQLKKLSFEEIKKLFEATMRMIQDFVPIERKVDKEVSKFAGAKSSKRDAEEELDQGRMIWFNYGLWLKKDSVQQNLMMTKRVLWVEMKRLFKPDADDEPWKLQRYMHDPLKWRFYNTCGVYHVSTERGHDIFMLVEKDYPLTKGLMTVKLVNKL